MTATRLKGITFDPVTMILLQLVPRDHAECEVWLHPIIILISIQYIISIFLGSHEYRTHSLKPGEDGSMGVSIAEKCH